MDRRNFLKTAGLGVAALAVSSCGRQTKQPNIVLILVDDLGWADVGCYGNTWYETPNIDRLAAEGVRFTNGYAACAVCSPTRSSVMTGRYPTRTGITDWIHHWYPIVDGQQPQGYEAQPDHKLQTPKNHLFLGHEEITIAEVLKKAGYTTCHVGKWHLGKQDWYPETQGFDFNIGGYEQGQPDSYFDPYNNPRLPDRKPGEYLTDREADEASGFIRRALAQKQPFFLYMAHYAVHTPIQGKEDLIKYYKNKARPADRDFYPEYAAMVHSVDQAVGRIVQALEEGGVLDETLIIFTSDNGGLKLPWGKQGGNIWTDNTPLRAGKGFPYEGGIREPFIVRWPGHAEKNVQNESLVCSIDLLPTICEVTGQPLPDKPIDGISIVPFLRGKEQKERTLYWHFPHYWGGGTTPNSAIRDGDWKLIRWYEDGRQELYNLRDDLSEEHDRAAELPQRVAELSRKLDAWLEVTGAKLPRKNPDYRTEQKVEHLARGRLVELEFAASPKYGAGDRRLLTDGFSAGADFRKGWLAFEENDLAARIDLGALRKIRRISMAFLQNQRQWIFLPRQLSIFSSADGSYFTLKATVKNDVAWDADGLIIKNFVQEFRDLNTRYLKIVAENMGRCPADHPGKGGKAWLFADEIIVL